MNASLVIERRPARTSAHSAEDAALRRVSALMRLEAEELEPGTWLHSRLVADGWVGEWGDRVVPELAGMMADAWEGDAWTGRSGERCPLEGREEAALRRLAAHLRAEAAELGDGSTLGRRLEGWAIRIALDCSRPEAPPRLS